MICVWWEKMGSSIASGRIIRLAMDSTEKHHGKNDLNQLLLRNPPNVFVWTGLPSCSYIKNTCVNFCAFVCVQLIHMFAQNLILSPRRQRTAVGCIGVEGSWNWSFNDWAGDQELCQLLWIKLPWWFGGFQTHGATPLSLDGLEWKIRKSSGWFTVEVPSF